MKNKKAGDKNNWKTEWKIKEEAKWYEVQQLYSTGQKKSKILLQWRETKIKLVYKGGNKERIQEIQRGIFLMNIV